MSDFKKFVINSPIFIDKSLLIKDFLKDRGETLLITYPRRWGKSINLNMIKSFFSIEVDENGNPLPLEKKENHKLFLGGEIDLKLKSGKTKILNKLKIAEYKDIIDDFQGQYPVVYIDFKNTRGDSYGKVLNNVKAELFKIFSSHKYLTSRLQGNYLRLFNKYIDPLEHKNLTENEVQEGLLTLSSLLNQHFGKRCFILMDEYDAAINDAYINHSEEEAPKIIELFRCINERTFKGNTSLEKGLITGVFRIAKANLFSGLNNLKEYNILDTDFFQYYGFTQQEVDYLLKNYLVPEDLAEDIKNWYNGYSLYDYRIYNPWSIVNCLSQFEKKKREVQDLSQLKKIILQSYWEESGNINFITPLLRVPSIKNKVEHLIKDEEPLFFNLTKQISVNDFKILKELINLGSNYQIDESAAGLLFSYLFASGYLTVDKIKGFRLPNKEIKIELERKLLKYYEQLYNIKIEFFNDVTNQLQKILDANNEMKYKAAIQSFKDSLTTLLAAFPEFAKISKDGNITDSMNTQKVVHGNEDLIHSIMSYIALQLRAVDIFGTEIYLGDGRADIMVANEANKKVVIIEFKYGHNTAKIAMEQIYAKNYARGLLEKYDTVLLGVNVHKDKTVDIEYETIPSNNH